MVNVGDNAKIPYKLNHQAFEGPVSALNDKYTNKSGSSDAQKKPFASFPVTGVQRLD